MSELNKTQRTKLVKLISIIRKGQKAFLETATAVYEINKEKLYSPHKTLAKFCREEFDFSANDTNRYRNAGALLVELKDFEVLPKNEGQCRQFLKLSTTAEKIEAWSEVVRRNKQGTPITAMMIAEVIAGDAPKDVRSTTTNKTLQKLEKAYSTVELLSTLAKDDSLLRGLEKDQIDEVAVTLKNIIVAVEEIQEMMNAQIAKDAELNLELVGE